MTGSKTSLIKSDGTPRKKKKKKAKKAQGTEGEGDAGEDYGDLAAELHDIKEDVVGMDTKDEDEKGKGMHTYQTSAAILQSQPIDKIFFETNSKSDVESR